MFCYTTIEAQNYTPWVLTGLRRLGKRTTVSTLAHTPHAPRNSPTLHRKVAVYGELFVA